MATSNVTRRQRLLDGQRRHPIIDPRSEEASSTGWLSVTVYAKSILYAEAFATALLIAGPAEAQTPLSRVDELQYAAVDFNGVVTGTLENLEMIYIPEPFL